jgi:CheY-like chemotaxis protein
VAPRSVLVVDDDPTIRALFMIALQDEGYRVSTAEHGAAALKAVERDTFQVIVLDIQMPVMDGVEFVRAYRALPGHQARLVIMSAGKDARRYCDQIGADHYLAKPFELDSLLTTVKESIGEAAS